MAVESRWRLRAVPIVVCLGMLALAAYSIYAVHETYIRQGGGRIKVQDRMKAMSIAMMNASDENGNRLMPRAICDKDGKPLLSWRVGLLPYIGRDDLYQQFNRDEPWDGPNNGRLIPQMPETYAHPFDRAGAARGQTYYRVFTGPNTPFPDLEPPFPPGVSPFLYPSGFRHGTSNTIIIVEAGDAVPWTKPDELPYDPTKPLPKLGGHLRDGFVVALGDGTAQLVSSRVSEETLRAVIDPTGDGPLGAPDW
jgi:Protein of unknown function (DUF1559)